MPDPDQRAAQTYIVGILIATAIILFFVVTAQAVTFLNLE